MNPTAVPPSPPLRDLLVHLDNGPRAGERLRWARALAAAQGAELTALYAVQPAYADLPLEVAAGSSTAAALQQIDEGRRAMARKVFDQVLQEPGPAVAWAHDPGEPVAAVRARASTADLLVLGQHDPDVATCGVPPGFVPDVLVDSGKPAVVLPYIGVPPQPPSVVLVAWKPVAEAARAVAAALPLLRSAREVHLAHWGGDDAVEGLPTIDTYLKRRGVAARLHRLPGREVEAGERMLSLAADLSAELLVMGCYGHSRAREWVLGGATRSVLRSMTLPVLMAH